MWVDCDGAVVIWPHMMWQTVGLRRSCVPGLISRLSPNRSGAPEDLGRCFPAAVRPNGPAIPGVSECIPVNGTMWNQPPSDGSQWRIDDFGNRVSRVAPQSGLTRGLPGPVTRPHGGSGS